MKRYQIPRFFFYLGTLAYCCNLSAGETVDPCEKAHLEPREPTSAIQLALDGVADVPVVSLMESRFGCDVRAWLLRLEAAAASS